MTGAHFDEIEDQDTERELRWARELRAFAFSRFWSPEETVVACRTLISELFLDDLGVFDRSGRMINQRVAAEHSHHLATLGKPHRLPGQAL